MTMALVFCPICGGIMNKVPMTVSGEVFDFWVCDEGDYEAPARVAQQADELSEQPEPEQESADEIDQ